MLKLPPALLALAENNDFNKALAQDIEMLSALAPLPIPESYFELITQFGYIQFDPLDDPCRFAWEYREPEMAMDFKASIRAFMPAHRVRQSYVGLVLDDDDDLPKFPNFMLPIGLNAGQDKILLECGGESDRIWYWEYQGDRWGEGNNVRLGFVADTLSAFLNKLHVPDDF